MQLLKRPGATLLVIGLALFFVIRPVIGSIWFIGGILSGLAFVVGLLGMVGGGYLLFRSFKGAA
ncbi:MAG: hypothetical protein ACR2P0_17890 [Acidimicrobiales bacterium]